MSKQILKHPTSWNCAETYMAIMRAAEGKESMNHEQAWTSHISTHPFAGKCINVHSSMMSQQLTENEWQVDEILHSKDDY